MGRMMSFNPHEENRMFRLTSGHLSPRLPRRAILAAGAAVLALGLIGPGGPAAAQDGIVRMVVPMAAGGPADFVARTISEKLREIINAVVAILSGLFLLYVSYAGYKLSVAAQLKVTDVLRVSYYWIDIAVPVGFVIIALYMFAGAFKSLRAAFAGGKA